MLRTRRSSNTKTDWVSSRVLLGMGDTKGKELGLDSRFKGLGCGLHGQEDNVGGEADEVSPSSPREGEREQVTFLRKESPDPGCH